MSYPSQSQSSARLFNGPGRYHHARVNAEPDLRPVAEEFQPAQDRLRTRHLEREEAGGQMTIARAVRDAAEAALLDSVRSVSLKLLSVAGHSRTASLYATYFPGGVSEVIQRSRARRLARIEGLMAKLKEQSNEAIATEVAELETAYSGFLAAEGSFLAARTAYREARAREETEKLSWLKSYRASFARLTLRFPGDPKKVEEFFISHHRGDGGEEDEPPSDGGAEVGSAAAGDLTASAAAGEVTASGVTPPAGSPEAPDDRTPA